MKYQCTQGHKFTHPAKLTIFRVGMVSYDRENDFLETAVCPICKVVTFEEWVEPEVELEDVISVEYVNVGAKIAEGYRVKEIYAKSCTLIKPKKKVEA
jgi:Zn ribbon nucleic-acid-binding protein